MGKCLFSFWLCVRLSRWTGQTRKLCNCRIWYMEMWRPFLPQEWAASLLMQATLFSPLFPPHKLNDHFRKKPLPWQDIRTSVHAVNMCFYEPKILRKPHCVNLCLILLQQALFHDKLRSACPLQPHSPATRRSQHPLPFSPSPMPCKYLCVQKKPYDSRYQSTYTPTHGLGYLVWAWGHTCVHGGCGHT